MKLELKHLAGYLPYGVKIKTPYGIEILEALGEDWIFTEEKKAYNFTAKPILRPLSDLTKEIEVNGEKFVPMGKLKNGGTDLNEYRYLESKGYSACDNEDHETCYDEKSKSFLQFYKGDSRQCGNQLEMFEKLHEWHIDVYGLIDNNLAIDINEI